MPNVFFRGWCSRRIKRVCFFFNTSGDGGREGLRIKVSPQVAYGWLWFHLYVYLMYGCMGFQQLRRRIFWYKLSGAASKLPSLLFDCWLLLAFVVPRHRIRRSGLLASPTFMEEARDLTKMKRKPFLLWTRGCFSLRLRKQGHTRKMGSSDPRCVRVLFLYHHMFVYCFAGGEAWIGGS